MDMNISSMDDCTDTQSDLRNVVKGNAKNEDGQSTSSDQNPISNSQSNVSTVITTEGNQHENENKIGAYSGDNVQNCYSENKLHEVISQISEKNTEEKENDSCSSQQTSENIGSSICETSFIGPVIPEQFLHSKAPIGTVTEPALEKTNSAQSICETDRKNDKTVDSQNNWTHNREKAEPLEPVNKKMRYEDLDTDDIEEMCEQVLDESSFNLSKKEKIECTQIKDSAQTSGSNSCFNTTHKPELVTSVVSEFQKSKDENYLRGCKWAPDGSCLLTNSNDNQLRLFDLPTQLYQKNITNIPEMKSVVVVKESDTIYDFCWYPMMTSENPETSCFVSSCKDSPVHLWDAFSGQLRCSYRPYNHVDELSSTYSLAFSNDGQKLFCGSNKMIRIFDADRPGRDCKEIPTYSKHFGQSGIVSCIVPSPLGMGMIAAGSYNRSIAIYNETQKNMVCMFEGQQGGVTHMLFSPDGTKLYSGGRKDPEIICWDLRSPGQILFVALRQVETNQRMYFELDKTGKYLVSGNQDGKVCVWDTMKTPVKKFQDSDLVLEPALTFTAHNDTVNGVSFHSKFPLLATSSGQRHFPKLGDSDDSDTEDISAAHEDVSENSIKLWWFT